MLTLGMSALSPLWLLATASSHLFAIGRHARAQGSARRRRLRVITLGTGTLAIVLGCVGTYVFPAEVRNAFIALLVAGLSALLLSVLPTERRTVTLVCCAAFLLELLGSIMPYILLQTRDPPSSCGKEQYLTCAFTSRRDLMPRVLTAFIAMGVYFAVALRLGWLLAHRQSGRHMLDAVWQAYGLSCIVSSAQRIANWALDGRSSAANAAATAVMLFVLAATSCIGLSQHLRSRLIGWISSRGAAGSSATKMAQLMGAGSTKDVMKTSQELLRSVDFSLLRSTDWDPTQIPGDALSRTRPAHIGEIDAFVSHSWQADPAAKWAALEKWANEFREQHGRWPLLWIDRFCVDRTQLSTSIACLPVFVSAANTMLVLYDETFLSRMWCVVELFAFLITLARVGGGLEVRRLPDAAQDEESAGNTPGELTADKTEKIRERLRTFDVRFAVCSQARDKQHLLDLIDAYPGGIANFNSVVQSIFFEQVFDPRRGAAH